MSQSDPAGPSDSDSSPRKKIKAKGHKDDGIGQYSCFKIFNALLYVITLCLTLGYFTQTKYNSKFVYYMF